MMMRHILTSALFISVTLAAFAQQPADSLENLTIPLQFQTNPASFKDGKGVRVDTLDIADGRLLLVLRDDHTWTYIKNFDKVAEDQVFKEDWIVNSLNTYGKIALADMPFRTSICLIDSVSNFVCPHVMPVFSKFGYRHGRRHQGVDLPLTIGTPIKSAFDGRVRVAAYSAGYGNLIVVRHENGLETYYGHLSKFNVTSGQWVRAGDVIGYGGSTGRSTGPHLHFETRYRGFAFDPQWIIDFKTGELRANVFVLLRKYLDASSRYTPQSIDEEEDIYAEDEKILAEEQRIAAEKAAIRYHTVKSGETISAICRKYGITQKTIIRLNPNLNVDKIRVGQKIRVN